jgi:hypothetical protein
MSLLMSPLVPMQSPLLSSLNPKYGDDAALAAAARPATVPMDASLMSALAADVAEKLMGQDGGEEKHVGAAQAIAELRIPVMGIKDASVLLAASITKLSLMLSAVTGSQDPIKSEQGASAQATEGAAVQFPARGGTDGLAVAPSAATVTGADADIAGRSANAVVGFKPSRFADLLALLRQVLLSFEKLDRDNSARMVIMQREMTINAGDKGVEKAKESVLGNVTGGLVTAAVGLAGLKQSNKSTSMQTESMATNLKKANATDVRVHDARGQVKAHSAPADLQRPARGIDGSSSAATPAGGRAAADLQADADVDLRPKNVVAVAQSEKSDVAELQLQHSSIMAQAQKFNSNSIMLNMVSTAAGGSVTSAIGVAAEMTEGERQLLLNVAETLKRVADQQQDQSVKTRDMRDSAAQLWETLQSHVTNTSSQIIQNF